MKDLAIEKLKTEYTKGVYGQRAEVMKDSVLAALEEFCRQDGEFAQAVYQGGKFTDCMKEVEKNVGGSISDLEAYRRAVRFYFPGADVKFHMTVQLCGAEEKPQEKQTGIVLNLEDFL